MIPGSANPLLLKSAAAAGGYQVSRSLRFNSSDSGFCSRTFGTAGNRTTWTWAGWLKRSGTSRDVLFAQWSGLGFAFEIDSSSRIDAYDYTSGYDWHLISTPVYRDPSAWYHIVLAYDTTQATASNRIKLYVNGTQVTTFSTETYPSPSYAGYVNTASAHEIGGAFGVYLDGYLADIHFIDGQALTPSSFTEVSATTGQLIPKAYTGTYGTNGFYLQFADNSSNTATTLGKDTSGNSNNWTPNNLSVTAGAGNDSLVDTPTSYGTDTGAGGEVRGNYCTLNPLTRNSIYSLPSLSNGNLDAVASSSGSFATATFGVSNGKYYWEFTAGSNVSSGSTSRPASGFNSSNNVNSTSFAYRQNGATVGLTGSPTFATYQTGDTIGIALNVDSTEVSFYKNGSLQGSGAYTYSNTANIVFPGIFSADNNGSYSYNFGQRPFAYQTPGTNRPAATFKALCDTNLPAPLTAKPNTVMDVVLYTGTGAALTPTSSLGFNPDWIWIKSRSAATDHALYDVVRGAQARLESNTTDAEVTTDGGVTAFNSAGFTLGTLAQVNTSSATYAAWCWDAGTSTVSNTAGSITSQVRANVSAGFSVVGWTSNGASGIETTGHGLGVSPDLIIVKNRDASSPWQVFHSSFSNTASDYLFLNTTDAKVTSGATIWTRSSTTFGYRQSSIFTNGQKGIAYCFAAVVGFSSFGSYVGNGSADGPFVYLGFRPKFVLTKRTDSNDLGYAYWAMFDGVRSPHNVTNQLLYANLSVAESTDTANYSLDLVSNGFKVREDGGGFNANGGTYIYAAFAESPFQFSRAR